MIISIVVLFRKVFIRIKLSCIRIRIIYGDRLSCLVNRFLMVLMVFSLLNIVLNLRVVRMIYMNMYEMFKVCLV